MTPNSVKTPKKKKKIGDVASEDDDVGAYEEPVSDKLMQLDVASSSRPCRANKKTVNYTDLDSDEKIKGKSFDCEYLCIKPHSMYEGYTQALIRWDSSVECESGKRCEWKWADDINVEKAKRRPNWTEYQHTPQFLALKLQFNIAEPEADPDDNDDQPLYQGQSEIVTKETTRSQTTKKRKGDPKTEKANGKKRNCTK